MNFRIYAIRYCFLSLLIVPASVIAQVNPQKSKPVTNVKPGAPESDPYTFVYDTTINLLKKVASGTILFGNLITDSKGTIYSLIKDDSWGKISKLVNNEWVPIPATSPENCFQIWFAGDDQLVMKTVLLNIFILTDTGWQSADEKKYEQKYQSKESWSHLPPPPAIFHWNENTRQVYQPGKIILHGRHRDNRDNYLIYEFANNNWNELVNISGKAALDSIGFGNAIVVDNAVYVTNASKSAGGKEDNLAVLGKFPVVTARKLFRFEPIPLTGLDSNAAAIRSIRQSVGIFTVNNKKGLRNINGDTLIYPVFQSITLGYIYSRFLSVDNCSYAFHLVSADIDFYAEACTYHISGARSSLSGFVKSSTICKVCQGAGKHKDNIYSVKVREWVPEEFNYSTGYKTEKVWNTNTNSYDNIRSKVYTSTSKGGYYKDAGYEQKVIPGSPCNDCVNGTESVTAPCLTYDPSAKTYFVHNSTRQLLFKIRPLIKAKK